MKEAVAKLAVVTAERERYVYAYNSLAAELKRLETTRNSSSNAPGRPGASIGLSDAKQVCTPARSNSLVQNLRAAVAEGRKWRAKHLLEAQMVWPSLAMRKHGYEILLLAIATSDADIFQLLLTAVAAASHEQHAFGGSSTTTIAAGTQVAGQKLSLAITAGSRRGLEFLTLINESALAPTALEWANGVRTAYTNHDQERAVACMKGMVLSHDFGDDLEAKAHEALRLLKYASHPPPHDLFAAVVESCASDLQQMMDAANKMQTGISLSLPHFLGRLAVLRQDVEMMRSAA